MMNGYYHVSLICLNGHVIDNRIDENAEKKTKYCPTCGERTMYNCQHCAAPIRGEYESIGFNFNYGEEEASVPFYCHACGKPYPWTTGYKEAAKKMVDELPRLRRKERTSLKQSVDDLMDNTTDAEVAAMRFKRLTVKAGRQGTELLEYVIRIVGGITGEAVKRILVP